MTSWTVTEVLEFLTEKVWCKPIFDFSVLVTRVASLPLDKPELLTAGEGGVGVGDTGTGTEDLPPKAVVGRAVLFPSQCLHCPCVKWGCWDWD